MVSDWLIKKGDLLLGMIYHWVFQLDLGMIGYQIETFEVSDWFMIGYQIEIPKEIPSI